LAKAIACDPLGRRLTRDRARQRGAAAPTRNIAGAGRPAKDTQAFPLIAADTDGATGGAGSASDPACAMIDQTTFAKMKAPCSIPSPSRQRRRDRVLHGDRRSPHDLSDLTNVTTSG